MHALTDEQLLLVCWVFIVLLVACLKIRFGIYSSADTHEPL